MIRRLAEIVVFFPSSPRARVLTIAALVAVGIGVRTEVSAHTFIVDQANEPGVTVRDGIVIPVGGPVGQEFVPTMSSLDVVEVQLHASDDEPSTVFVRIHAGGIAGPVLGVSGSVELSGTDTRVVHFDFPAPVALTPSSVHVLEVVHESGADVGVGFIPEDTYSEGKAVFFGVLQPHNDLWFREGPVATCTLDLDLRFTDGTLTMDFVLFAANPVIWSAWLIVGNRMIPMWSLPLPAVPATPVSLPVGGFPDLGVIGVLSTFTDARGVVCWDFATVDTRGP